MAQMLQTSRRLIGRMTQRFLGGTTVFPERTPVLEELFEAPVLKSSGMDQDTTAILKNYTPPALLRQVEAVLCAEFTRVIQKTDWSEYEDPILVAEQERAANLLHLTLTTVKGSATRCLEGTPDEDFGAKNTRWLQRECALAEDEIRTGDVSRWEDPAMLVGKQRWAALSEQQKELLKKPVAKMASNPNYHPNVKRRILCEMVDVIQKTTT